ncbi:hypothetical protein ACGF3G_25720 [Streptomyces sp. NPDC048179]
MRHKYVLTERGRSPRPVIVAPAARATGNSSRRGGR